MIETNKSRRTSSDTSVLITLITRLTRRRWSKTVPRWLSGVEVKSVCVCLCCVLKKHHRYDGIHQTRVQLKNVHKTLQKVSSSLSSAGKRCLSVGHCRPLRRTFLWVILPILWAHCVDVTYFCWCLQQNTESFSFALHPLHRLSNSNSGCVITVVSHCGFHKNWFVLAL